MIISKDSEDQAPTKGSDPDHRQEDSRPEPEISHFPSAPPPYSPSSILNAGPASSSSSQTIGDFTYAVNPQVHPPPDVQPTNYLVIKEHNSSIKGRYVIDPDIDFREFREPSSNQYPGSSTVTPFVEERNLHLESHNGSVSGDIWVLSSSENDHSPVAQDSKQPHPHKSARVFIELMSHNGSVNAKLYANGKKQAVKLVAFSKNGSVNVSLPSSFTGPVTLRRKNGGVTISDAVSARLITFSDMNGVRHCFLGDPKAANFRRDNWQGSTLDMNSHNGRLRLSFSDEPEKKGAPGLLSKLLGMKY